MMGYGTIGGGTGGGVSVESISATKVIQTSELQFISAPKKAQVDANTEEISSLSQRMAEQEQKPTGVSDGKIKLDADDTVEYLAEKIDNDTLQINNNKLVVKWLDGLLATLNELNSLQGVTGPIQAQINNLAGVSSFRGVFTSLEDLEAVADPQAGEYAIVSDGTSSAYYFYYGDTWDYSHETTSAVSIDINSGTTGILPKSRYEKQSAGDTSFVDADGNIQALNTQDAIKEVFRFADDVRINIANVVGYPVLNSDKLADITSKIQQLKVDFANNLTNKGVIAYSYNTLQEMINKVSVIPNVTVAGTVKSTSKLNITAPYTHTITLNEALKVEDICTSVLQYVGNDSGVVHYQVDFNNSDASSFDYEDSIIFKDGFMQIKDTFEYALTEIETDYWETGDIDFSLFSDIGEDLVVDVDNLLVTIKGLRETVGVAKANGDISLAGVEWLDVINYVVQTVGNGKGLLAVSFDSGLTYQAYNGTEWVALNVDDKADFAAKGMSKTITDALTDAENDIARDSSNFIRFAYYLERPTYADNAKNDRISLTVTMLGYNELAPNGSFDYSYDESNRTLTYELLQSGTYTINYVDGN